jgi:DNA-binding MarR family transcriptional regulator
MRTLHPHGTYRKETTSLRLASGGLYNTPTNHFCKLTMLDKKPKNDKILPFWKYSKSEGFLMPTENTAQQFLELIQKFICLRPRMIPPEHVVQFKKKMEGLKNKMGVGNNPEEHGFLFRILILLSQSATPITMGELSAELNVPMSTATRIVDGLVRGGMVERVNDPSDRRVVRVRISKNGRELYEQGMDFNKQRVNRLLKVFSNEEQIQLLKLMNKLFDSLASENEQKK